MPYRDARTEPLTDAELAEMETLLDLLPELPREAVNDVLGEADTTLVLDRHEWRFFVRSREWARAMLLEIDGRRRGTIA